MKVFVLGTGGWGIALAMLLHQNGHQVTSWPMSGSRKNVSTFGETKFI